MANKSTKHRLQCGLNITNKQSFFPLTLSLSLSHCRFASLANNYWPSECCLWSWPILINSFDCRQSQHTTTQQQHAIHNREYNAKRKAMWESEKWPGANGHVIRKNKIHLLVKVLCFVFMLFIIDFSASLRFFLTVVVLDSGDLLARNEPMHWEFQIKRAYKMRARSTHTHSKTAKREKAKRSVGQWQCKASNWLAAKPFAQPRLHPHTHTDTYTLYRGQGFNR